jgi:predicted DNA binding CopG/RHH family protein
MMKFEKAKQRVAHPLRKTKSQRVGRPALMKREYDFSKLKELKNPYAGKKKAVGINLSPEVLDYFKGLADETGLPYQKLIDLYLLDCAKKRKKLNLKWVA